MTYENARLGDGNICTDRDNLYVASFSVSLQAFIEVNKTTGVIVKEWPTDTYFTAVYGIEFDGFYWWSLEKQTDGFIVRKWKKAGTIFVQLVKSYVYTIVGSSTESLALEHYSTEISLACPVGSVSATVSDAGHFRVGDELVFGPSSAVGYTGNYEESIITGIVGNTIQFSPQINSGFSVSDDVYAVRAFWVFVDSGASMTGELIKYSTKTGNFLLSDTSVFYRGIKGSTFYNNYLQFVKVNEVFWIEPNSLHIYQVMAIDNFRSDRGSTYQVYDMYGYGDYLYRLQTGTSYKSGSTWYEENWSTCNTVASKITSEVYMVSLVSEPKMLHIISAPAVTTASANIICEVFDQYFSPVTSKVVNFTTSAGTLTSSQETTDSNGVCRTVFIGGSQTGLVSITASTT